MEQLLERRALKKNFLKEIIMRLDYQGVLQAEIDRVVLDVKPYLKENSFNRYSQVINNKAVFGDNTVKEASSQVVHSFFSDANGFKLEVSTTCLILSVHPNAYSCFELYSGIFCYIAKALSSNIDFLAVKRFGLRKINYCFIQTIESINRYFKPEYYALEEPIEGMTISSIKRLSTMTDGTKNVNLGHIIELGEINAVPFYKITLDSDLYTIDDETIQTLLNNADELISVNQFLFAEFYKTLTEYFVGLLCSEEQTIPEELEGVVSNEG